MKKKQAQRVWMYKQQAPKFTSSEKAKKLEQVKSIIEKHPKLSKKVSRVDMRANRIYLYELVEQLRIDGAIYIKPLIEDKYLEFPYARITLNDANGNSCNADFQRHNEQWMTLHTGTLAECLSNIETDNIWF